jgi:hypothetical protein
MSFESKKDIKNEFKNLLINKQNDENILLGFNFIIYNKWHLYQKVLAYN